MTSPSADPTAPASIASTDHDHDHDAHEHAQEHHRKLPERTLNRRDEMNDSVKYGRLSVQGMNFNIPTSMGTHDHALDQNGVNSWRYKTIKFIHSNQVQVALMVLLFCDVMILFIELLFLAHFPLCNITERDAISCCPASAAENETAANDFESHRHLQGFVASFDAPWRRSLSETGGSEHEELFCAGNLEAFPSYPATCDPEKWHAVHTTEFVLFVVTLIILSIFMIELTVSMIALTPQIFFRQFFFLLDFVIISVSLALEIVFHVIGDEAIFEYVVGLLVVARIWRFIRIGHGIVEITNEMAHREYLDLMAYTEDLQNRLRDNGIDCPDLDDRMKKKAGAEDDMLTEVNRRHQEKYGRESSHAGNGQSAAASEEAKA